MNTAHSEDQFKTSLAVALGITVSRLQELMTAHEIELWRAYFAVERQK